ncbi:MAG: enolase C-terminal domain-like protein [Terriglobia bacterium]|jgi:galactonate dehydratase
MRRFALTPPAGIAARVRLRTLPNRNIHAAIEVARRVDVPVGTGERLSSKQQFAESLREDAITVIMLEPLHVGGILAMQRPC